MFYHNIGSGILVRPNSNSYPFYNQISKDYVDYLKRIDGIISVRCPRCNAINHRFPRVELVCRCKE